MADLPSTARRRRRCDVIRRRPVVRHLQFGLRIGVLRASRIGRYRFLAATARMPASRSRNEQTFFSKLFGRSCQSRFR